MKLKHCPFCGKEAEVTKTVFFDTMKCMARCKECGLTTAFFDTEEEAAGAWNRRYEPPNEPLTLEKLAQMEEEPVWITFDGTERPKKASHWYLFIGRFGETFFITGFCGTWRLSCENYGKTWLAYRHRPKEEKS